MFLEASGTVGSEVLEGKRVSPEELIRLIESQGITIPAAIKRRDPGGWQFNYINLGDKDRHGQLRAPQGVKMSAVASVSAPGVNLTVHFFRNKTVKNGETIYSPHKLSYNGANPWFTQDHHAEALFLYLSGNCQKEWMANDQPIWVLFDAQEAMEKAKKWAITQSAFIKDLYQLPEQELRVKAGGINIGGRMIDTSANVDAVVIAQDVMKLIANPQGYDPAEVVRQFNHSESNWLGVIRSAMLKNAFRQSPDGYWQWAEGDLEGSNIIKIPPGQEAVSALITWATNPLNKDILLGQLQRLGYVLPSEEVAAKRQQKSEQEVAINKMVADGTLYFHAKTNSIRDSEDQIVLTVNDPAKWHAELLKDYKLNPDKYASLGNVPK